MEIIKADYFKSTLTKGQITALAIDEAKNMLETTNAIDAHIILKKANLFLSTLMKENEKAALMDWDSSAKDFYTNVSYNQGGKILDYDSDHVYKELKDKLAERKKLLDTSFQMTDPIFDGEGVEVPKVKVKSYRKESLNVKI